MEYKYYVQEYAKKRADSILPVPKSYSLRGDFGAGFISDFSELTQLLKRIYLDVAENPAAYGCELFPLTQEVRGKGGVDNESNLSLDRIVKCLRTLCDCGEVEDVTLKVKSAIYNKQIKKVENYQCIIERLKDFGFIFDFDKSTEYFIVKNESPRMINALKTYMNCWNDILTDEYLKSEIKKNGYGGLAFYYHYYLFDYKVTANQKELDPLLTVKDDCYTWDNESKNMYIHFYEYSKKYTGIRFSKGAYYIGKNRICTFWNDGKWIKLKLKNPANYISEIEKLPESLQACFVKKVYKCTNCGCLGNKPEECNNRIYWKKGGVDFIGCSMGSFYFNEVKVEDLPKIFTLLECEYGIKREGQDV